jgi:hypothetical protein
MTSETENGKNQRKRERLQLSLPIRVQYYCETAGEIWEETTDLIDVTPFGAGFALSHKIEIGRLIKLTIPMPRLLRCYDHLEQQYKIWGLVRHIRPDSEGESPKLTSSIGVAFIGKNTPTGYAENPGQIYEVVESDELGFWRLREVEDSGNSGQSVKSEISIVGTNLRKQLRHTIPLNVVIEVLNERGETIASELTVTEDVSATGTAVFTTLEISRGRLVRLSSEQYGVTIIAVVRARRHGKDGVARLHLEFIDSKFPFELPD